MNPLSALYGAIVRARNNRYQSGALKAHRLQGPVISIGNLSVGGSGKTPFLIALGTLLQQRGIEFDVLSRGYGRATTNIALVDPAGSPRDFGDEPLLIARKLNVPVVVGADRYAAGQLAEQKFGARLHLLDDGFQHRRLARDFDIVMVDPGDVRTPLLPVGRLREPLSSLRRADAVVLTNDAPCDGLLLAPYLVWRVRRGIAILPEVHGPCFAFCGIARPQSFFEQLGAAGVMLSGTRTFRDHHPYTDSDAGMLLALRKRHADVAFVTTEKDAINLQSHAASLAPLHVVPVRMELENADSAVSAMLARIAAHRRGPA